MLENSQTCFKILEHRKIFKGCLAIFQRYATVSFVDEYLGHCQTTMMELFAQKFPHRCLTIT